MNRDNFFDAKRITFMAILTAFVILFQAFGSYIKIGATNFSFVLVPIVLGGIILGKFAGLFLGFVFSLTITIMGLIGADPFTNFLLINAPFQTIFMIFAKGCLAGFIPALIYGLIAKKNKKIASIIASILAPIINTGLFILLSLLLLKGTLVSGGYTDANKIAYFLIIICAGINFLVEFGINLLFAPTLLRVAKAVIKENK